MKDIARGVALLTLVTSTVAGAVARAQDAPLDPVSIVEPDALVERRPVSGGTILGVLTGALDAQVRLQRLTVAVPEGGPARLCVTVTTRDGRYRGELAYDRPTDAAGRYRLAFPTRHAAALAPSTAAELAVLATLAVECDAAPERILVASWSGQIDPGLPATLFAGSANLTGVWLQDPTGTYVRCQPIPAAERFAYDLTCALPPADRPRLEDWRLVRENLSTVLDPIPVPLYLP